jgi:hypothetical protein
MSTTTTTVKSTELTKGTRVRLSNGWEAILEDNQKKAKTRLATVFGFFTEMGSVYTHDIALATVNGEFVKVEHTPTQKKFKKMISGIF